MLTEEEILLSQVDGADWLRASDAGVFAAARVIARRLDRAREDFNDGAIDNTEATQVEYLRIHLVACLNSLGFTPEANKEIKALGTPVGEPFTFDPEAPFSLYQCVEDAIGAMPWLTRYDRSLKNAALNYAARIDYATYEFMNGLTHSTQYKAALFLVSHLHKVLTRLGGTPESRMKITGNSDGAKITPMDELRKKRLERQKKHPPKLRAAEMRAYKRG